MSRDPQGFVVCYTNWDQDQNQDLDPGSKAYREDDIKDFHSPAGDPPNSPRCEASKFSAALNAANSPPDRSSDKFSAMQFPPALTTAQQPLAMLSHCSAAF